MMIIAFSGTSKADSKTKICVIFYKNHTNSVDLAGDASKGEAYQMPHIVALRPAP